MIASQINIDEALKLSGYMSPGELTWLASFAKSCEKIVEFGCFHGRSTRALADNIYPGGRIYAVDPWNGEYRTDGGQEVEIYTFAFPIFRNNLHDHIRAGTVIPSRAYSENFRLPFQVDMIFIDGDHTLKNVRKDLERAEALVKSGGIISGHDYGHAMWPGVKQAVDEKYSNINLVESIWWIQKS